MKRKTSKVMSCFGTSSLIVMFLLSSPAKAQLLDPSIQAKFVNPLPIPARIDATNGGIFEMEMKETWQWLGLNDPVSGAPLMTQLWGYGPLGGVATFPGPTFVTSSFQPIQVTWHNNLPVSGHFLPVDPSLHLAHPHGTDPAGFYASGNVPTVAHLHGGHTESASDGLPEAWFTQGFGYTGPQFVKQTYTYDNSQEAATLWYHDHALGITRLNVYAGLAGFYLLEDSRERQLAAKGTLPKGKYDIEIVIQDRMFDANGQLFLPAASGEPWFGDAFGSDPLGETLDLPYAPSVVAEFFGDFILVNGVAWPFLDVEPTTYRFRLLNGSDSRFYALELENKQPFLQIATDNGLLPSPVALDRLILAPGERAEIVVDFSTMMNQEITLLNYGPDEPFKGDNFKEPGPNTGQIMKFRVNQKLKGGKGQQVNLNTTTMLRPPLADPGVAQTTRKLGLFEGMDADFRLQPLLGVVKGDNEKSPSELNGSLAWFEPITENPGLGDVEIWEVYNATEDAHPIHLHLVSFQIIDRQPFSALVGPQSQIQHDGRFGLGGYIMENSIAFTGPPEMPALNEQGWKDTFIVPPGYVGRVKAKFDLPGRYVWHCHILSHEDHEMMRPFHVGPIAAQSALKSLSAGGADNTMEESIAESPSVVPAFALYPNPVSDLAMVEFTIDQPSELHIRIYDMKGSVVFAEDLGTLDKGSYTRRIHTTDIERGVYIFELRTSEHMFRERIVIVE